MSKQDFEILGMRKYLLLVLVLMLAILVIAFFVWGRGLQHDCILYQPTIEDLNVVVYAQQQGGIDACDDKSDYKDYISKTCSALEGTLYRDTIVGKQMQDQCWIKAKINQCWIKAKIIEANR